MMREYKKKTLDAARYGLELNREHCISFGKQA